MARALLDANLHNFVIYDRQRQVGGNWIGNDSSGDSSIYEGVRSISSKRHTAFSDFPFPEETSDYPTRHDLLVYLQRFARHFQLEPHLQRGAEVRSVTPEGHAWRVTLASGHSSLFDAVCVCNGHHAEPSIPELNGHFSGSLIHSHSFRTSLPYAGKRVLVLGGGNSALDIAADFARRTGQTTLSLRRGYHIVPRHILGIPSDEWLARLHHLPDSVIGLIAPLLFRLAHGPAFRRLPRPNHRFFQTHPLINSEFPNLVANGAIRIQGSIASVDGHTVTFADQSKQDFDLIVACTGYRITFPFLTVPHSDLPPDTPLYLRIFPPQYPGLFFLGLIQPNGSIWPLADFQATLVAKHLKGRFQIPSDAAARAMQDHAATLRRYLPTSRHTIEVDFFQYRRSLRHHLDKAL